jgi:hypothetical protein
MADASLDSSGKANGSNSWGHSRDFSEGEFNESDRNFIPPIKAENPKRSPGVFLRLAPIIG